MPLGAHFLRCGVVAAIFAGALLGCAPKEQCPASAADPRNLCTNGIPNLHVVGERTEQPHVVIYRGGQPTPEGWAYLHDTLGVRTVVKLNAQVESWGQGLDAPASRLGMKVIDASIPPVDYGLQPRSLAEPFKDIPEDRLALAVGSLAAVADGGVYVHCSHGRDRTGLIVGLFRVFEQHWSPARAKDEMMTEGFRPLNLNLFAYWDQLFSDADDKEATKRQARLAALIQTVQESASSHERLE